jgi:hypothetical protein
MAAGWLPAWVRHPPMSRAVSCVRLYVETADRADRCRADGHGVGTRVVKAGLVAAERLLAADPDPEALNRFARATGGGTTDDNAQVARQSDVIFLAVKPQQIAEVIAGLRRRIAAEQLVVSIAAGIRLAELAEGVGADVRLVRVMPNTPCLVGQGACGFCLGAKATAEDGRPNTSTPTPHTFTSSTNKTTTSTCLPRKNWSRKASI